MKTRREFFKTSATAMGALGVAHLLQLIPAKGLAESSSRRRGGGGGGELELVDPNEALAKAVNYQHTHDAVKDKSLKTERGGLPFAQQFCDNCSLYTKTSDTQGRCTIFPKKLVAAKGWCSSWNKKG